MKKIITAVLLLLFLAGIVLWGFNTRSRVITTCKVKKFSYTYNVFSYDNSIADALPFAEKVAFSSDGKFVYVLTDGKLLRFSPDFCKPKRILSLEELCKGQVPRFGDESFYHLTAGDNGKLFLCVGQTVAASNDYGTNWHFYKQDLFITASCYMKSTRFTGLVLGGIDTKSYANSTALEIFDPFGGVKKVFDRINGVNAIDTSHLYPSVITSDKAGDIFFSLEGESGYIGFLNINLPETLSDPFARDVAILCRKINAMAVSGDVLYVGTNHGLFKLKLDKFRQTVSQKLQGKNRIMHRLLIPEKENSFYVCSSFNDFWSYGNFKKISGDLDIVGIVPSSGALFVATRTEWVFMLIENGRKTSDKFFRIGNCWKGYYAFHDPADKTSEQYVKKLFAEFTRNGHPLNYPISDTYDIPVVEISSFAYSDAAHSIVLAIKGHGIVVITDHDVEHGCLTP